MSVEMVAVFCSGFAVGMIALYALLVILSGHDGEE